VRVSVHMMNDDSDLDRLMGRIGSVAR
jgi:hypothetical protein